MKRRDLIRWLESHGCELLREGGRHSWWHNPSLGRRSAVPRHREINENRVAEDATPPQDNSEASP
ncbi:MAG: type II toxin-antitoxin system HicA family toxin [Pseudomonadota bacterium]